MYLLYKNLDIVKILNKYHASYRSINKKLILYGPIKVQEFTLLKSFIIISKIEVIDIIVKEG